ncbi:MAG: phage tail sheath subtilisin-like domain-containing protein, partial [Clostridiaceae bacterium]|nr:phage tail sheath subtilisin-like domain-containing protein [Clostridiaceae bacterium]
MAVNLASPGVSIREIDLTVGGTIAGNTQVAALCGPFQKGPVNTPISIRTEQELFNVFGAPILDSNQNEYWFSVINYLSYGGEALVVRCDSSSPDTLTNSNAAVGGGSTDVKIVSETEYNLNSTNYSDWYYASRNPGAWANGLTVCTIDAFADQTISGINTSSIVVGYGVTVGINTTYAGIGEVVTENGFLKGIVTGVGNSSIDVKIVSKYSDDTGEYVTVNYSENTITSINSGPIIIRDNFGNTIGTAITTYTTSDWYDNQILQLGTSKIYWKNIAQKPRTSEYGRARNSINDEIHIVVVDDSGTIVENFTNLSKAVDGKLSPAQPIYYKNYIAEMSTYIYAGVAQSGAATGFSTLNSNTSGSTGNWGSLTQGTTFSSAGNKSYSLTGGTDYKNTQGEYKVTLNNIVTGYKLISNPAEYNIDFLLAGPSAVFSLIECQAKANILINIASTRKDCIAVISAPKASVVSVSNSDTQTLNIINFFAGVTPSNYAVFDSGHKYTYDGINNQFLYLACNSDIAGLMARTSLIQNPWYSPAGASRGVLNNAIKLAYTPSQSQRDSLYSNAINPIIASPGQGIILFGDKTASNVISAFDRINVRRLFLTIEDQIGRVARSQLFEFNDVITRNNFVNIIEPYLRDIK